LTDRPILFSAPMVWALLDGRKTQTRRVLKSIPYNRDGDSVNIDMAPTARYTQGSDGRWYYAFDHPKGGPLTAHVARFAVGDRLWVKETWRTNKVADELPPRLLSGEGRVWFEADRDNCDAHGRIRQSIFMPRWASRLTLIVTEVRVERLNDCSEADAIAEGIHQWRHHPVEGEPFQGFKAFGREPLHRDPRLAYRDLWNSINGPGAWEANPWVVAVTFTVEQRNIDNG
jgi:hypothetical protein